MARINPQNITFILKIRCLKLYLVELISKSIYPEEGRQKGQSVLKLVVKGLSTSILCTWKILKLGKLSLQVHECILRAILIKSIRMNRKRCISIQFYQSEFGHFIPLEWESSVMCLTKRESGCWKPSCL